MAIPKKGTRTITIEKDTFRWLIRKKATYGQSVFGIGKIHIAIEHAKNPGTTLFIYTDRDHPKDWNTEKVVSVTPSDISNWIKQALALNWEPEIKGPQFSTSITKGKMKKTNRI